MSLLNSVSALVAPLAATADEIKPWMIAAIAAGALLALLLITLGELYIIKTKVNKKILYGALCYVKAMGSVTDRAVFLLTAFGWILLLERIVPNKRIPVLSSLGQNTMPVYLLHGFVVCLAEKDKWFHFSQPVNFALTCLGAIMLLALFGNKYVGRLFHKIF